MLGHGDLVKTYVAFVTIMLRPQRPNLKIKHEISYGIDRVILLFTRYLLFMHVCIYNYVCIRMGVCMFVCMYVHVCALTCVPLVECL